MTYVVLLMATIVIILNDNEDINMEGWRKRGGIRNNRHIKYLRKRNIHDVRWRKRNLYDVGNCEEKY